MATGRSRRLLTVDDYMRLPPVVADRRWSYGADPAQFGDLYLPSQPGPHPVVIMLHGGCWRAQYGLAPLGQLCTALASEGLAVWNVEYRRLGNGGGWPTTFTDVAAGADALRDIAADTGLDLSHVVAMGHSAGGHLALWLAGRRRIRAESALFAAEPLALRGVVSLAGVPDLAEAVKRDICGGACQELVGGLPEAVPERYQDASPLALSPLGIPQWHVIGVDDQSVPADYVQQCVRVAQQYDQIQLDLLPDTGHFEPVVPTTAAWMAVRHAVLTLLGRV
jgi:acetyl esterase/lipase